MSFSNDRTVIHHKSKSALYDCLLCVCVCILHLQQIRKQIIIHIGDHLHLKVCYSRSNNNNCSCSWLAHTAKSVLLKSQKKKKIWEIEYVLS